MMKTRIWQARTVLIAGLLTVFVSAGVQAATYTWDGGGTDNNWLTDANWNPDGTPVSDGTATLSFSGNTRTAAANTFAADTVFAGINFLNDYTTGKTTGFTLSGNRITLGGNVATTVPTVNGTITDTISLGMLLSATRTFTVNNTTSKTHDLTVSGVIGETGGSFGLIKGGAGNLTLTGANTYTGPTVMSGGKVIFNSIKNVGGGASSFGAPTTAAGGTITNSSTLSYSGGSTATDRPFVLTGGFTFDISTSGSTLTLNGDIKGANAGPTFRGNGTFVINGILDVGSVGVNRTDGGTVYLNCPTNPFTGNVQISAGAYSIASIADSGVVSPIGKGTTITLGQNGWNTTGKLQFTGASGGSCNRAILVETSTNTLAYGGIIENTVTGQTLRLSGPVSPGTSSVTRNPRLYLQGAGDGELSGVISGSIIIDKNSGTGTWTLASANTYTGDTAVSTGTLLINGSTHAASAVSVGATGSLGGTGVVNGAVSLTSGAKLVPGNMGIGTLTLANSGAAALTLNGNTLACELSGTVGISDRIAVSGTLVLNGINTLALTADAAPAGTYTLMTYAAKSGIGTLALDTTDPNYRLTVGDTSVTLVIGGTARVWKGDGTANVWDSTTANWLDGSTPVTYVDNAAVVFDNTGSAIPAITIASGGVAPFSVTVDADTNAYTLGGAALTGPCGLTKTGTNALALTGANTYSGATFVNAGTLTLSGSLSNSSVTVANGATLTESAGAVIAGADVALISYGTTTLAGTNTYGGVTMIGVLGGSNIILTVNNNTALGSPAAGTVVNGGNAGTENQVRLGMGVTVTGETLTLNGGVVNRAGLHYSQYSGTGRWYGDIVISGGPCYLNSDNAGGTLEIGGTSGNAITGSSSSLSLRGIGTLIVNSSINIGTTLMQRDDAGTAILMVANNVFGDTVVMEGTLRLGVSDAMPSDRLLTIGKSGNTAQAIFDLNGKNQTVAGLADQRFATGSGTQRIISATPATLIVSNTTANSFGLTGSSIEGEVSLVKIGASTLTLTSTNSYSGATVVSNGTLVVSATGTLGNSTNIVVGGTGTLTLQNSTTLADTATLSIANGGTAKVSLASGVNESVYALFFGDNQKRTGTYGATGSGAKVIDDTHFSGTGVLTVLHDKSGSMVLLR